MMRLMYPEATPLRGVLFLLVLATCLVDTLTGTSGGALYSMPIPAAALAPLAFGAIKAAGGVAGYLQKKFSPTEIQKRKIGQDALNKLSTGKFEGVGARKLEGMAADAARARLGDTKAIEADLRRGAAVARGGGAETKKLGELAKARQYGAAQTVGKLGAVDQAAVSAQKEEAMRLAGMATEPSIGDAVTSVGEGAVAGMDMYASAKANEHRAAMLEAYKKANKITDE